MRFILWLVIATPEGQSLYEMRAPAVPFFETRTACEISKPLEEAKHSRQIVNFQSRGLHFTFQCFGWWEKSLTFAVGE